MKKNKGPKPAPKPLVDQVGGEPSNLGLLSNQIRYLRSSNETLRERLEKYENADLAHSSIVVEFGESCVTLRDTLDNILLRRPLDRWTEAVGFAMAQREAPNIGCRISEQARFSIRGHRELELGRRAERGAGPGMKFESTGPTGEKPL